jgi:DNA polymerase
LRLWFYCWPEKYVSAGYRGPELQQQVETMSTPPVTKGKAGSNLRQKALSDKAGEPLAVPRKLQSRKRLSTEYPPAPVPALGGLAELREAAAGCQACPLWKNATQTVFGKGPPRAKVVFVGEQPGDQEDRVGQPFVGPAGQILDQALSAAGIDRSVTYVTNAVKHFKFVQTGKRRMHDKPNPFEIAACRPWLEAELDRIKPLLVVGMGVTACRSLFNSPVTLKDKRGKVTENAFGYKTLATIHPSALLRAHATGEFESEFDKFVADLRLAKRYIV